MVDSCASKMPDVPQQWNEVTIEDKDAYLASSHLEPFVIRLVCILDFSLSSIYKKK